MIAGLFRTAAIAFWLSWASAAGAQTWKKNGDRLDFDLARISVPSSPGVTAYYESREFSHKGSGLDTAAEFKSPDGAVFATVYAYLTTLADPGVAAIATDNAITANSGGKMERGPDEIVGAAGRPRAALETRYAGYRGTLTSRAAFLRADRWMIKVRVSGPDTRGADVDATLAAILDGMRLGRPGSVRGARFIAAEACELPGAKDAKLLPDSSETIFEGGVTAVLDPLEPLLGKKGSRPIPARFGDRWCRATIALGDARVPVLRALDAEEGSRDVEKSVLLIPYSDGGRALELVRTSRGYLLLHHDIGEAAVLGTFDAMPSDAQIRGFLSGGGDDAMRVRTRGVLKPNGDTELRVPPPEEPKPRGGTATKPVAS